MKINNIWHRFVSTGGGYFLLLFAVVLVQTSLFHRVVFGGLLVSSLWRAPVAFFTFWAPKVAEALFLSGFVFLSRRRWWTVAIPAVVGVWCMANYVYFRANGLFISLDAMLMAGNLEGFSGAASSYFDFTAWLFPLLAVVYAVALVPLRSSSARRPVAFLVVLAVATALHIPATYLGNRYYEIYGGKRIMWGDVVPWVKTSKPIEGEIFGRAAFVNDKWFRLTFVKQHSIVANLPNIVVEYVCNRYYKRQLAAMIRDDRDHCPALPAEVQSRLLSQQADTVVPRCNLVVLLLESFESWLLNATDDDGREVTPNLCSLAEMGVYVPYVRSQVREGVSGDGQMILNTGILPLPQGAACVIYADNRYPNWAGLFASSATLVPTSATTWNQSGVNPGYGYRDLYSSNGEFMDDMEVMLRTAAYVDTVSGRPFVFQALTIGTHSPFELRHPSSLVFKAMPKRLYGYIACAHYADSCIGELLKRLPLDSTLLVVTGDHTIFKSLELAEYRQVMARQGFDAASGRNFVPLIVAGPGVAPRVVTDTCYQMDIFPTIMQALGCGAYGWRGFGVSILDSHAVRNRVFTEAEAYRYSDVIIKSDWLSAVKGL